MRIGLALLLFLRATAGAACSCAFGPLDGEAIRAAKHVFLFRLLAAEAVVDAAPETASFAAVGRIEVVQTLRGDGAQFREVRYSTYSCCGTRLDVGHLYIAFVKGPGPSFDGNIGSLLSMGSIRSESLLDGVGDVMAGRAELEDVVPSSATYRLMEIPPPPAPCPPPGSR